MKVILPCKIYGTKHPYKIKGREIRNKKHPQFFIYYLSTRFYCKNAKMFFKRTISMNGIICHRKGKLK